MARDKKYSVVKDGHIIGQYAQLPSALKKAEIAEADVYEGGQLIKSIETINAEREATTPHQKTGHEQAVEDGLINEPVSAEEAPKTAVEKALESSEKEAKESLGGAVKILVHLYVRNAPSQNAKPIGTLDFGKVIDVEEWKGDWFGYQYNGQKAWSMYGNGKFARKL